MEQHPIPQQISSYEFRLVGDMTLKQFFQVSGGVIISLFLYGSGLPVYLKWPLIFLFVSLGGAIAFLPIEERPLQTWIFAFFKAVYSPTQFLWQKKPIKLEILEPGHYVNKRPIEPTIMFQDKTKLNEYLGSLPAAKNPLDEQEAAILTMYTNLFESTILPQNMPVESKILEETLEPAGIRIRTLSGPFVVEEEQPEAQIFDQPQPQVAPVASYVNPSFPPRRGRPPKPIIKPIEYTNEIPVPATPPVPNLLVGMVSSPTGRIVEGAIMEIKDEAGNPVRALRTNKVGQFRIATPLPNGNYQIVTDKEGLQFNAYNLVLKGEIIPPFEIKALQQAEGVN
jgi:hypothetical protein